MNTGRTTQTQIDQRSYFVRMAATAAANRAAKHRAEVVDLVDNQISGAPVHPRYLADALATAREWKGIERACYLEERRLARLKHEGARP